MKRKELSNASFFDQGDQTLPKSNILRGKRDFQKLFTDSNYIYSDNLNLRYTTQPDSDNRSFKVGFISPKKIGNAVKRNRMKRLMREAFRKLSSIPDSIVRDNQIGLHLAVMARKTGLTYTDVYNDLESLLQSLRDRLQSDNKPN